VGGGDGEADAATPDHGRRCADRDTGGTRDGSDTGEDGVAEERADAQVEVARDARHGIFVHHRQFRERADAAHHPNGASVARDERGPMPPAQSRALAAQ